MLKGLFCGLLRRPIWKKIYSYLELTAMFSTIF